MNMQQWSLSLVVVDHDQEDTAEALGQSFTENSDETIVIGLESRDCFAIEYDRAAKRRLPKLRELAYQIEPDLPCDADNVAIHALGHADGWLLIAVDAERCAFAVEAMRDRRLTTVCIAPLLFLLWPDIANELDSKEDRVVITAIHGQFDLVVVKAGRPIRWFWLGQGLVNFESILATAAENSSLITTVCDEGDELKWIQDFFKSQAVTNAGRTVTHQTLDVTRIINERSRRIAEGKERAMVNLMIGPLAPAYANAAFRRPLTLSLWSIAILLAAVTGAFLNRSWQYQTAAESYIEEQRMSFQQVFPRERIPIGIQRRLVSAHRELQGTHGNTAPIVLSASGTLYGVLASIPEDCRFEIDLLELTPERIEVLQGTVRTFEDAERISAGLIDVGFAVQPVSTSKTNRGVSIRLERVPWSLDRFANANGRGGR